MRCLRGLRGDCIIIIESLLLALLAFVQSTALSQSPSSSSSLSSLAPADLDRVRQAFLAQFGMSGVPQQAENSVPPPAYIWDLYDKVQEDREADSIRHYYPVTSESAGNIMQLHYNLSLSTNKANDERISRAELKLKLDCLPSRHRVDVYEVDQLHSDVRRLVDTKLIAGCQRQYQWLDFDVTEALTRRRPNGELVDFAVELNSSPSSSMSTTSRTSAALVIFVDLPDTVERRRSKRSASSRRRPHQHRHRGGHRTGLEHRQLCQKRELYVDFAELNWLDWILAPYGYQAYQCSGECINPLSSHFNVTNHAIVQSLINSVNPGAAPPPSCVPTETRPLTILYIDIDNRIVIKTYPDMIVESCGCH